VDIQSNNDTIKWIYNQIKIQLSGYAIKNDTIKWIYNQIKIQLSGYAIK